MPSAPANQAEKEYQDYVRRRQEAGYDGTRMTADRFTTSRGHLAEKRPPMKGNGQFEIPSNEYKPSGFQQRNSELGNDPLTAVRTMRNNMRRLAIMHKDGDRAVKAHLCESACNELTKKEEELVDLSKQRSNALMTGNTKEAERIMGKMKEVKESALQGSYADLIVEGNQMKAFGVNSKWTPNEEGFLGDDHSEKDPAASSAPANGERAASSRSKRPSSTRASSGKGKSSSKDSKPKGRFRPRGYIDPDPPKEVSMSRPPTKSGKNGPSEPSEEEKNKEQMKKERAARNYTNDTDVKKNARLSAVLAGGSTSGPRSDGMDDPYSAPTHVGTCPHCDLTQNGLSRNGQMEKHYSKECKMMNTCKYCLRVVLIPQLTDHYINRCEFVQGRMTYCNDCNMAIDKTDQARGAGHPMCRGRPAPDGTQWCPLCSIAVNDNPDSWKKHCTDDCLGNPRQDGPQLTYQQYQEEARAYADEPRRGTSASGPRATSSGGTRARTPTTRTPTRSESRRASRPPSQGRPVTTSSQKATRPTTTSGPVAGSDARGATPSGDSRGVVQSQEPIYVGRLIDADKLVLALSELQEKKKKAKRQALKDVE